jgi:hypothetical protein
VYRDGNDLVVDIPVNAGAHEKYEFVNMRFLADVSDVGHNDRDVDECLASNDPRDVGLKALEACRKLLDNNASCTCYISNGDRLCTRCEIEKEADQALSAAGFPSSDVRSTTDKEKSIAESTSTAQDFYDSLKSEIEHVKFLDKDDERIVSVCEGALKTLSEIALSKKSFPVPVLSHHYEPKYNGEVMSLLWIVADNSTFEIEFVSNDKVNWNFVLADGSVTNEVDSDRHDVTQKFISNMKVST